MEHTAECHLHKLPPCPYGEHKWMMSWPGNYCLQCGNPDVLELCVADNCACHCHDEMWRDIDTLMREQ